MAELGEFDIRYEDDSEQFGRTVADISGKGSNVYVYVRARARRFFIASSSFQVRQADLVLRCKCCTLGNVRVVPLSRCFIPDDRTSTSTVFHCRRGPDVSPVCVSASKAE